MALIPCEPTPDRVRTSSKLSQSPFWTPIWGPDPTPIDNLGYIVLSATMIAAALIELIWGVAAERRPLEDVARPLTFVK
jgi:hypothetical protein